MPAFDRDQIVRTLVTDRAKLLAYGWAIVRNDHVAEDLYQDVLIAAMDTDTVFTNAPHLLKWSRVTMRNKALGHLRKERGRPAVLAGDVLDLIESHWESTDSVSAHEMTDALRTCLATLTPNARRLIEMRYRDGLTGVQVAKRTDRSAHTVYVALGRAYKQLGDCINGKLFGADPGVADA